MNKDTIIEKKEGTDSRGIFVIKTGGLLGGGINRAFVIRRKTGNTGSAEEENKIDISGKIIMLEKSCTEQDICLQDIHKV